MYFGNLGIYVPRNEAFGNHPTLSNNLFSYYRFEDAAGPAGTRVRDAHQGRDLTVKNDPGQTAVGKSGLGFLSDDTPGATLERATSDFTTVNSLTVSAWVSSASFSGDHTVASCSTPSGWFIRGLSGGVSIEARLHSTTANVTATSTNYVHGQFNHILAMFNGPSKTVSISVNGETLVVSGAVAGTLQQGASFAIGPGVSPSSFIVDEMAIWGRLLTLDERTALYGGGTGLFY